MFFKKYFSYYLESVFEIVDLQIVLFTDTKMLHRRPNDFFTKKIGYILNNEAIWKAIKMCEAIPIKLKKPYLNIKEIKILKRSLTQFKII